MKKQFSCFLVAMLALTLVLPTSALASLSSLGSGASGGSAQGFSADHKTFLDSFQGKHEVSLFSGSLNYGYPLWIPEGRNGMTPKINLTYSNVDSRYNSPVGYGWSLPRNAVYRTPKKGMNTLYEANEFTADIMGSSEELIMIDAVQGKYAPKNESSFTEYAFSSNSWSAVDKSGTVYTFGPDNNTRQYNSADSSEVYQWMLTKIEDTNGNFITFDYSKDGNAMYLNWIRYSGFGGDQGVFKILFYYTARPTYTSYRTRFQVDYKKLVDKIDVISYESGSPDTVMTYDFGYNQYNDAIQLLKNITVKSGGQSLPPTTFTYFDGSESIEYKKINGLYKITEPYGGIHEFRYKPASFYQKADGTPANKLPFFMYTIHQHKTRVDSSAPVYTTTYDYADGHYFFDAAHPYQREYAGFGEVTVTDPTSNIRKVYFHQSEVDPDNSSDADFGEYQDHISKKGRMYREEAYDDSDNLRQVTINKWEHNALPDQDPEDDRYHVILKQGTTVDYGENDQAKTKAVEYLYGDSYGNVTEVRDYGEVSLVNQKGDYNDVGTDKVTTYNAYAYNTSAHIVGLMSSLERKDQSGNFIARQKMYYDNLSFGQVNKGNLTKQETYANNSGKILVTTNSYNDRGLMLTMADSYNHTTTFTYGSDYIYPQTVANHLGHTTTYEYDLAYGKPTKVTDPNGGISEMVLDGFGRVTTQKVKDTSGQMRTIKHIGYNLSSSPVYTEEKIYPGINDVSSNNIEIVKRTYFDGFNRPIQVKAEGEGSNNYSVTSITYDERGNTKEEYLPKSSTSLSFQSITSSDPKTSYTYDALGRVKTATNDLGTTSTNYYDGWTKVTDMEGNRKDFYSDVRGNLVEVKEYLDGTPHSTAYEYSANNFLTKITNSEGKIKNMTYNLLGWKLTEELFHASGATPRSYSYTYDYNGNVLTETDAKSQTTTYTYDQLNRLKTVNNGQTDGTQAYYTYDQGANEVGRLSEVSFNGSKYFDYNILGQMTKESKVINMVTYHTSFAYDLLGNPLSITYPDTTTVTYAYNNAGQLEQMPGYITDLNYSQIGSIAEIHYANGAVTTNTYDPNELYRLTDKVTTVGGSNIQDIDYAFDSVGNITNITDTSSTNASKTANYGYDDLYRLTSANITNTGNNQNYSRTYAYSPTGNITNKSDVGSYTYADVHPHAVTAAGSENFTYDNNGSLLTDGTWTHSYDTRNRLTSSAKTGETIAYTYDESKTRTTKNDGTKTVVYVSDLYEVDDGDARKHVYAGGLKIATIEPEVAGGGGGSGMPSDTNLVGHWAFDEGSGTTAIDSSGNGNDGVFAGDPTYVTGVSGTALDFDGNGDYVDTERGLGILMGNNVANMSVSLWFKADTTAGERGLFYMGLWQTTRDMAFNISGNNMYLQIEYPAFVQASPFADTTDWHHVVVVYDGASATMYIDNTEIFSEPYTSKLDLSGLKTTIGTYAGPAYTFDGQIDEVRVYNTVVTPAQVTALYNDPIQLPSNDDLVGHWAFDEGGGTSLTDSSGNGNTGVLYNGTAYTSGISGTALQFDGIDDYGRFEGASIPAGQDGVSTSFWIYADQSADAPKDGLFCLGYQHHGWLSSDDKIDYGAWKSDGNQEWLTDGTVTLGEWNHITNVIDYANDMAYSYINGTLAGSNIITGDSLAMSWGEFGRHPNHNGNHFTGKIDEARLYDKALAAGEAKALYQNPSGEEQSGGGDYAGGVIFHHNDHLSGSNIATDENGNVIELNDYYPYGDSRIEEKAEGYTNDYMYTGQERDEETSLYYYGARYYDPVIGRFTSVDPWSGDISDPQSLNKYSYVRNNPLKYVDPSGESFTFSPGLSSFFRIFTAPRQIITPKQIVIPRPSMSIPTGFVGPLPPITPVPPVAGDIRVGNPVETPAQNPGVDIPMTPAANPTNIPNILQNPVGDVPMSTPVNIPNILENPATPETKGVCNGNMSCANGKERIRDTGLRDVSDSDVSSRSRDRSLDKGERRRYKKEEKARKIRRSRQNRDGR